MAKRRRETGFVFEVFLGVVAGLGASVEQRHDWLLCNSPLRVLRQAFRLGNGLFPIWLGMRLRAPDHVIWFTPPVCFLISSWVRVGEGGGGRVVRCHR